MRAIVVDACVAIKWFVREEDSALAVRLLETSDLVFFAPDIFRPEVVNGLLRQRRSGHLSDDLLDRILVELDLVMPELVSSAPLMSLAVRIARRLDHPVYDCLYLAPAELHDMTLVTADVQFAHRCLTGLENDPISARIRLLGEYVAS